MKDNNLAEVYGKMRDDWREGNWDLKRVNKFKPEKARVEGKTVVHVEDPMIPLLGKKGHKDEFQKHYGVSKPPHCKIQLGTRQFPLEFGDTAHNTGFTINTVGGNQLPTILIAATVKRKSEVGKDKRGDDVLLKSHLKFSFCNPNIRNIQVKTADGLVSTKRDK